MVGLGVAVPITVAAVGLAHQTAAAYSRPATPPTTPDAFVPPHDPSKPTAAIVVGTAGAEVADVLGPYETLSAAGGLNVYIVAADRAVIPLTGGLDLTPHLTFGELQQRLGSATSPDVVVVPAMPDAGQPTNTPVTTWVGEQHRGGSIILGVCHGARILAAAALLDGRPATSHWLRLAALRQDYPMVRWQARTRYVDDGNVITTGGIISGIDGSLRVIERLLGPEQAARTSHTIGWRSYQPGSPAALPPSTLTLRDTIAAINTGFRWNRPTLGVLLTDGVGELEPLSVFDPYAGQSLAVTTIAFTLHGKPVHSRHGLTLTPRSDLSTAADQLDRLVVPGHTANQHRVPITAAAADLHPTPTTCTPIPASLSTPGYVTSPPPSTSPPPAGPPKCSSTPPIPST